MRNKNKKRDRSFELSESETSKKICPFYSWKWNTGRSADDFPVFVGVV